VVYVLRLTRPLLGRFPHASHATDGLATTTRLGEWYANHLNVGRHRLVLCTSAASLLSVVVPAKDLGGLPVRLAADLASVLRGIGVPEVAIASELREMADVRIDRTASRSILGSMNDFAVSVDAEFRYRAVEVVYLSEVNLRLSETPCGPLGYETPRMRALALLCGSGSAGV
jgi:hypothetical protein